MESSYKKLARQRNEAVYQIKKALEQRRIHIRDTNKKIDEGINQQAAYQFENLQNAITLNELLDTLVKLYEIE